MEEQNKKIDNSWKEEIEKERAKTEQPMEETVLPEQPNFSFFVTTLSIQAGIALGEIPNPANGQKGENLNQAKLIIDTLAMLKEKTQGNLTSEEDSLLDNVLYELRMQYVFKKK